MLIRPYKTDDRLAVRALSVETAWCGHPGRSFIDGDDVFADILTRYFTDIEPESCWVAEDGGRVVGYLLGTLDSRRMERVVLFRLAVPIFIKALFSGFFGRRLNLIFLAAVIKSFFRGEFVLKDFYKQYPALLHINVEMPGRSVGTGGLLVDAFLAYLKTKGIKGVRLSTMSEKAFPFFEKNGFNVLAEASRSYFYFFIGRVIKLRVYGRLV